MRLIPAGPQHGALWYAWRQQPETKRYNPVDPYTAEELSERLAHVQTDLGHRVNGDYRWIVEHDGQLIGTVALKDVRWRMGYAEIAYGLGAEWHGRGLGTRAVAMLVNKAFSESRLVRLFATIASENAASRRIVGKLGFQNEGTLRQHFVIEGRRVDEVLYGLMRVEWEAWDAEQKRWAREEA